MANVGPHPKLGLARKVAGVAVLWLGIDLFFAIPIVWKLTRTEAWVRVGDPELHHAFRPMSHQTEQYGPEHLPIFINSLGAKDGSCRTVPPVAMGPRVAIFGDSFAEGWGIPFSGTVVGQLRAWFEPMGVDVLGFGISSHCPSLTERWMDKLARRGVRWDLAVMLIDPGDAYDEREVAPFLQGKKAMKQKNVPKFFRLRWYEYSLTYQFIRQLKQTLAQPAVVWDLDRGIRGNEHKILWLDRPGEAPWLQEGLQQSAGAVRRIYAKADQAGIPLLIAIYPYPRMMVQKKLENEYTKFWKTFSREEGIPLLDLTPLFAGMDRNVEEIYKANFIPGDFHWNAEGSARVAQALRPWIEKNLPGSPVQAASEVPP